MSETVTPSTLGVPNMVASPEHMLYDDMPMGASMSLHPEAYEGTALHKLSAPTDITSFSSQPISHSTSSEVFPVAMMPSHKPFTPHSLSQGTSSPVTSSTPMEVLTEAMLIPETQGNLSENKPPQASPSPSQTFVPVATDTMIDRYTAQIDAHKFLTVNTSRFSELTIETKDVIELKLPILGFEDLQQFILLPHQAEGDSPFFWLQSVEDGDIAFVVTHPVLWHIPYQFSIQDDIVSALHLEHLPEPVENYILVLCIVNIPHHSPEKPSINLRAPLVINQKERIGGQVVLQDDSLPIRGDLLSYMKDVVNT